MDAFTGHFEQLWVEPTGCSCAVSGVANSFPKFSRKDLLISMFFKVGPECLSILRIQKETQFLLQKSRLSNSSSPAHTPRDLRLLKNRMRNGCKKMFAK